MIAASLPRCDAIARTRVERRPRRDRPDDNVWLCLPWDLRDSRRQRTDKNVNAVFVRGARENLAELTGGSDAVRATTAQDRIWDFSHVALEGCALSTSGSFRSSPDGLTQTDATSLDHYAQRVSARRDVCGHRRRYADGVAGANWGAIRDDPSELERHRRFQRPEGLAKDRLPHREFSNRTLFYRAFVARSRDPSDLTAHPLPDLCEEAWRRRPSVRDDTAARMINEAGGDKRLLLHTDRKTGKTDRPTRWQRALKGIIDEGEWRSMVSVTFISADGSERLVDIAAGVSAMEGAVRGGVDGIDADCGGAASCATCHVHVASDWYDRLKPPAVDERDMLEFAVEADQLSRLSCQILVTPELDGLVLNVPASQR